MNFTENEQFVKRTIDKEQTERIDNAYNVFNNRITEATTDIQDSINNISNHIDNMQENFITDNVIADNFLASNIFINDRENVSDSYKVLGVDVGNSINIDNSEYYKIYSFEVNKDNVNIPENAPFLKTDENGVIISGNVIDDWNTTFNNTDLVTGAGVYNIIKRINDEWANKYNALEKKFNVYRDEYTATIPNGSLGIPTVTTNSTSFEFRSFYSPNLTANHFILALNNGANTIYYNDNKHTVVYFDLPFYKADNAKYWFSYFISLNYNVQIPEGIADMSYTFYNCSNLNQNIQIPESVTNMSNTFCECVKLNQNIYIPPSVTDMYYTFRNCYNLNQSILIPPNVTGLQKTFDGCTNLNQNIYIYSDKFWSFSNTFKSCDKLVDKYIHIPYTIPLSTSNFIYNMLVNGYTGINWTGRIINDLDPAAYPARGE